MLKATRPCEYVAFFSMEFSTKEGPGFAFMACDAFSEFAFNIGVETSESPESVLKSIYLLTEDPDFLLHRDEGFTLVLNRFEDLAERIKGIIEPVSGHLLYDNQFFQHVASPLKQGMKEYGFQEIR